MTTSFVAPPQRIWLQYASSSRLARGQNPLRLAARDFCHRLLTRNVVIVDIGSVETQSVTVNITSDDPVPSGKISLRDAVNLADGGATSNVVAFDTTVFSTAQTLLLVGPLFVTGTVTIDCPTPGVTVSGIISNTGSLTISGGSSTHPFIVNEIEGNGALTVGTSSTPGYMRLAPSVASSTVGALTINTGSTLDITIDPILISYAGANPVASIRGYLASASAIAHWTGTGLTSSTVAAQVAPNFGTTNGLWSIAYVDGSQTEHHVATALGVGASQILVLPALRADANLDGKVDFNDLLILAQVTHFARRQGISRQSNLDGDIAPVVFRPKSACSGKMAV